MMDPTSRIYAGEYVEIEKFPFFAGLIIYIPKHKDPYSMCGAALLSDSRLVTAAHCNYDGELYAEWMRVVLGSSLLFRGGLRIVTHKIVSHPDYDYMIDANDIAVIYLPYKINFTSSIFPIALPNERDSTMSFENYYAYLYLRIRLGRKAYILRHSKFGKSRQTYPGFAKSRPEDNHGRRVSGGVPRRPVNPKALPAVHERGGGSWTM